MVSRELVYHSLHSLTDMSTNTTAATARSAVRGHHDHYTGTGGLLFYGCHVANLQLASRAMPLLTDRPTAAVYVHH